MKIFKTLSFFILLCLTSLSQAQTVGTLFNSPESWSGYTLLNPLGDSTTYLINNCGERINQWSSDYISNAHAELGVNGDLYRSGIIPNLDINAGGGGGIIERFDWDNNLIWAYSLSNSLHRLHHDFEILPNGNILAIVWERKDSLTTILAGRDPDRLYENEVWVDKIIEIQPIGVDEGEIVWEWNAWDHLVQDFDIGMENYGVVAESPRKLDINSGGTNGDWMHCNAIDYNAQKDQIILSCPEMNEFYIIDHSTTTAEAATSSGGTHDFGGDFIYRWGNPAVYDQGSEDDQSLFYQHDVNWIEPGLDDAGKILLFNNRLNDGSDNYSAVYIIDPDTNDTGNYVLTGGSFGTMSPDWTYSLPLDLTSNILSSAQRLPNDNMLICSGRNGKLIEIDQDETIVWRYVLPISIDGPITQGATDPSKFLFNIHRYAEDFSGFEGRDLIAGDKIELEPLDDCDLFNDNTGLAENANFEIDIYPNPNQGNFKVVGVAEDFNARLYDLEGRLIHQENGQANMPLNMVLDQLESGMYLLVIETSQYVSSKRIIIN